MSVDTKRPSDDLAHLHGLSAGITNEANHRPKQVNGLVEQTQEAVKALHEVMRGIGPAIETFKPMSNQYVVDLRQFRVAAVAELSLAKRDLEDIRKFFLSPDHQEEMKRIREFVELCERFDQLKKAGTLDVILETVIKLTPATSTTP